MTIEERRLTEVRQKIREEMERELADTNINWYYCFVKQLTVVHSSLNLKMEKNEIGKTLGDNTKNLLDGLLIKAQKLELLPPENDKENEKETLINRLAVIKMGI